jgi:hypothetical protein
MIGDAILSMQKIKRFLLWSLTINQISIWILPQMSALSIAERVGSVSAGGTNYKRCYRTSGVNVADPISREPQHFHHLCSLVSVVHRVGALTAAQNTLQVA